MRFINLVAPNYLQWLGYGLLWASYN